MGGIAHPLTNQGDSMVTAPSQPTFEHHRIPLGIGEASPRLSWVITEAPACWRQAGYELQERVSTGAPGEVVRVESSDSVLVPWPFSPLTSRERRAVRVRVLGEDGSISPWSEYSDVEAGVLDPEEWQARMVGPTDVGCNSPQLRTTFELPPDAVVTKARLRATAHGLDRIEINGRRATADEFDPGWSAYESRLRVRTHDVTELLTSGPNAIGVRLGDGWWRGYLGWGGARALYGDELGSFLQLEATLADGSTITVATGADWRWAPGPILESDIYNGETFDARFHDPAWSTPQFDDSTWLPVTIQDFDLTTLVAPDGPPVRVVTELAPIERLTSPSGKVILDFGQNLVGRLCIRIDAAEGTTVTFRHAEVLEGGELATAPLREAKATDTYICSGSGTEEWAPTFTFHGFRYAEVTGWPEDRLDDLTDTIRAQVLHTDLERIGTFTCSDPLLQRFHENVVWGMKGNFLDIPTDCPQRNERLGWTGDLQVFAPTAAFLFDISGMLSSWLKDLAAEQSRYGGTPSVVPAIVTGYQGPMAGWADAATVVPWTLYRVSGDLEILHRQLPSMRAWVDEVAAAAGENLLWDKGYQFGDWLDPTAPAERPEKAATAPEIVATAYFARSARILADSAALLGEAEMAATYTDLADRVRDAFIAEYVTPSGRLMADAQTAYAVALCFGLLPEAARPRAAARLAELVRASGYKIATGFLGTPLICDALSAEGHEDVAYRLLLQREAPSWLHTVLMGATTIWERWDSLLPDGTVNPSGMTSFNHYAFGAVADWMHRVVAGLDADAGWQHLRIAPRPPRKGLTTAGATLRTPYGTASTSWRINDDVFTLDVHVPVGARATVTLPSGEVHEVGHGEHSFTEPFETESTERPQLTLDTPMGVLSEVEEAMALLTAVIDKAIPGAAEHMGSGAAGQDDMTVRHIAGMMPRPDDFLADVERGFAALNTGQDVPEDLTLSGVAAAREPDTPSESAKGTGVTDNTSGLTLEQKASLLSGHDFWSTKAIDDAGVPSIVLTDGPHGVRLQKGESDHLGINKSEPATCFPLAVAVGSSWNPEVAAAVGGAVGREGRALGVAVVLGPGVNIKRSPLGGRNFEYYSEDPLLSGALGTAHVNALQAEGPGASVKHFAANNQETERMRIDAQIDARTLREIYLAPFEKVVTESHPATVMCAYNKVNSVFCSHNRWLLTEVLREEWSYEGLVVSDWGAVSDRVAGIAAGMDLEMPGNGGVTDAEIVAAVREGRLDEAAVDASVARFLALTDLPHEPSGEIDIDAHHELARKAAAECIVLLRNEDGTLPLVGGQRLAVIGAMATEPRFQGGGSSRINPTRTDLALDELRTRAGEFGITVTDAQGYSTAEGADSTALRDEAVAAAADVDIAVVFAGLTDKEESEGFDRTHIDLPTEQVELIQAVAKAAPRTVVVLSNGGIVSVEGWHDEVDAIVEGFLLGQGGGAAIADVLLGVVNPSGHLAESMPLRLEDNPSWINFPGEQGTVRYGEGVMVGYRYYASAGIPVRYPFGHGLSYTTFETTALQVEVTGPDTAITRVTVANTGGHAGKHVVQVYVATEAGRVRRPVRELRAFTKVHLEPGETRTVELELGRRAFAYWDVTRDRWVVTGGAYAVEVCDNAHDVVASAAIELAGDALVKPLSLESSVSDWFTHPVVGPELHTRMAAAMTADQAAQASESADMLKMVESMPMKQFMGFLPGIVTSELLQELMELSRTVPGD